MDPRLKTIYASLSKKRLDAIILNYPPNISYLVGFLSRDSYLLVSPEKNIYFTDARYTQEAKKYLKKPFTVRECNAPVFRAIAGECLRSDFKNVGFEEGHLSFSRHQSLAKTLGRKAKLIAVSGLVEALRIIKDKEELDKIRQAIRITVQAFKFIRDFIAAGRKEIEVAAEMERFIRYSGADTSAFEIIIASGSNSCFPHHRTSKKIIKKNEPVLVDIGVEYSGYKSDLTRVFFLGKITSTLRSIYDIVLEAQKRALGQIKPAVNINQIDAAARQYIARKGYGGFFSHALGHGIGLEVHEEPRISAKEKGILRPGMVFTVEPAIYLPGRFGVRLEDIVLVTKKGCEVLSGALDK